jgi:hypothetical protein
VGVLIPRAEVQDGDAMGVKDVGTTKHQGCVGVRLIGFFSRRDMRILRGRKMRVAHSCCVLGRRSVIQCATLRIASPATLQYGVKGLSYEDNHLCSPIHFTVLCSGHTHTKISLLHKRQVVLCGLCQSHCIVFHLRFYYLNLLSHFLTMICCPIR